MAILYGISVPPAAIEGRLEEALYAAEMILPTNYGHLDKIGWSRSSRTDKGVHSLATVVAARLEGMWTRVSRGAGHFEYEIDAECVSLPEKINKHLPPEIRVVAAAQVPYHFDSRKSCIHRHYEYLIPVSVLQGSAYTEDREAWDRMLQSYVGRHHWHNFGHIERSKKDVRRSRRPEVLDYPDDDAPLDASQALENESSESSHFPDATLDPAIELPEISQNEPSLLDSAPGKTSTRPSLYALDELKNTGNYAPLPVHPSPSGANGDRSLKTQRKKQPHVAQFAGSTKFRSQGAETGSEELIEVAGGESAPRVRIASLSAAEVASLPLDDHLAQDAFFRTISAVSHDPVTVKGEKYVRISIQGDSFLLHQVRRMIGALVLTARGVFSEEVLRAAIDAPFRILTPRAPSRGLLLRDARFLELNWQGRDVDLTRQFSSSHLYPHMHDQWNIAGMLEGEEEELRQLEDSNSNPNPDIWGELLATKPIPEVRDIIPGYDDWLEWHYQESRIREAKREQRRTRYEAGESSRGRPSHQLTTRASF